MKERKLTVSVAEVGKVSALWSEPDVRGGWTYIYAPGAGSNLRDAFGAFAAKALAGRGIAVVRFQFPYMEAGKKGPDRPPILEAAWRAVVDAVRAESPAKGLLCAGGRSMGGRIGSQVAAAGAAVDGLALFAYPLHPPGKPEQMRTEHFSKIKLPVLFVSGRRDAFASPEELRSAAKKIRGSKVHVLEGADHGFAVPKSAGRTREALYGEAVDALTTWLEAQDR